jgi:predicted nucleic acid-binding protein
MALAGPLAGARLVALDTPTFIYLIERHPIFFPAVEPIFQAIDAGSVQAATSVLTLLEVLVKPIETKATTLADHGFRTPDSIHLATAEIAGADVFVTNDDKLRGFSGVKVVSLRDLLP